MQKGDDVKAHVIVTHEGVSHLCLPFSAYLKHSHTPITGHCVQCSTSPEELEEHL